MNVLMLLEMVADTVPDRVAVGSMSDGVRYRQLLRGAQHAAGRLQELSAAAAGLLDETSMATPAWLFAAAASGRPFVPLNYRLSDAQLQAQAREIGSLHCLTGSDQVQRLAEVEGVETLDRTWLEQLLTAGGAAPARSAVPAEDAVLLFTSGTTGAPKIVVLKHEHLVSYVLSSVEFLSAGEDEAILVSVPPYHIAGVSTILTSVYAGRRMVQLPSFTPEGWVEVVRDEAVTQAMVVPTMLSRILDVVEERGEELPALRHVASGGGRMPVPVIERALTLLPHVDWVNAYGLTETSATISVLGPEDHRLALNTEDPVVRRRLQSVGRPVPSVEVEIRDPHGAVVAAGQSGEVHVRGLQVSGEYRSHRAVDAEGWFATRDQGWLDSEGYLYLEGRVDDVIVRGAENLSPGEIEDVLLTHPGVADAVVVGVPDVEWGERVEAVVVERDGAEADPENLREWVRRHLRSSKTPDRIHFRPELPRNDLGKLLRTAVRNNLTEVDAEAPMS